MRGLRVPTPSAKKAERVGRPPVSDKHSGEKKKVTPGAAMREARLLIHQHRGRLVTGLVLMLISRLAGLVLPSSAKYVIDDVIGKGRHDLLLPIALAAGAATIVQAFASFGLSQLLGVAAQRAITDMRRRSLSKGSSPLGVMSAKLLVWLANSTRANSIGSPSQTGWPARVPCFRL